MSDSVDRVFVHALATVRRLPRTGSSRPPPSSRLRLYGLYKQSMEGDVAAILPRPTLPVSSPDPNDPSVLHRYASRDLRTREAQAEIEKWDAWYACAGLTRTEAKRRYISTLIDTMKEYASGTAESRELVGELEFVWNQIKSQNPSPSGSGSGSNPDERDRDGKLERAGIASPTQMMASFESNRPSVGSGGEMSGLGGTAQSSQESQRKGQKRKPQRTQSGLRVLSPVSQRDVDSIIEGVDEPQYEDKGEDDGNDEDDDNENLNTAPSSPLAQQQHRSRGQERQIPLPSMGAHNINPAPDMNQSQIDWQRILEGHLHALKTEIAALREQMSANHLLSSSTYSHTYYTLSTRGRIMHRTKLYLRTFGTLFFRQLVVQLGILVLMLIWGRWKGDLRAEEWVREVLVRIRKRFKSVFGGIAFWLLDLFSREGRLGFIGRILRVV